MSVPPPNSRRTREVQVAGRSVPGSAGETRSQHLSRLLGSRTYIWRIAVGAGLAFLIGAATGRVIFAVGAPLVALLVILVLLWNDSSRLAKRDFFAGFALEHEFSYSERMTLLETTPLLGAGDRRHCENYMEGPLDEVPGVAVGLSHYVFETREDRNDRRRRPITVYTPHPFTIAVVDLPRAMSVFPGVFFSRRGGWLGRDSWLDRPGMKSIELESSTLANKYELMTRGAVDRTKLLELFQPSFQVWLAELPLQLFFEYSGGTLVVYVPKKISDGEGLEIILQATERIAKRILKEGEPLQVVTSAPPPPLGKGAFPPPPPATKPHIESVPDLPPPRSYGTSSVPPPSAH